MNRLRALSSLIVLSWIGFAAAQVNPALFSGLKWRLIGPYRGGRSIACVGSQARQKEYYFGATGGGLWKTTDGGLNWNCVSDGFFSSSSVGAVAVSSSNPDVVYAGMGERDIRGDISEGDGVYKSTDAGLTWKNVGLQDTKTISKIVVDPKNPDIVYVAALGHVYAPNPERGVFKSTDGGKTWNKVLFASDRAGAVDLCMDPSNSEILYAATWDGWRKPYTLNSGGPDSKLWKSDDAGKTWQDITRNPGLPKGLDGKIGVAVSPANPKRVYAIVENLDGGIYKSDDAGATWQLTNSDRNWRQRAWYFSHLIADPKDADTVYVTNVGFAKSVDGGKTFQGLGTPHSDNHDLWIAPDDPKRMIETNDGGCAVSTDGGQSWTEQNQPTGQFYHVIADNAFPYHLLGAQQDSSAVRILSRVQGPGIGPNDWTNTAGGESGWIVAKPDDPEVVFGGNYSAEIEMINYRTGERRNVNPWPDNPMGWGAIDLKERFQWTFPIYYSPNDPNLLYTSSQHLFSSKNGGQTWKEISPDLTRNDPKTLQSSGGDITKDNTSVEYYGTIFAVAESKVHKGLLWTGSDDGLVFVNSGPHGGWVNVTPKDLPPYAKVSIIEASPYREGTAFLAVDNHLNDDNLPYIFRTDDMGKSWRRLTNGIDKDSFVRVVREDPRRKDLLYAGTEKGVYVSFNGGELWQPLQLNLPVTPVHDITFKDGDLCIATHGRGFWILDNVSPLEQAASASSDKPFLYQPADASRVTWNGFGGGRRGRGAPPVKMARNPDSGIVVDYYLTSGIDSLKFEFFDAKGQLVQTLDQESDQISTSKGHHRFATTFRYPGFRGFPRMILWGGRTGQIPAPPGKYTVKMTAGTAVQSRTFNLLKDPRDTASDADLVAQFDFAIKIRDRENEANDTVVQIRDLKSKVEAAEKDSKGDPEIAASAKNLIDRFSAVESEIYQVKMQSGEDPLNYPIKLNDKIAAVLGTVLSGDFRPTDQSYQVFDGLSKQLQVQLDAYNSLVKKDLAEFNKLLTAKAIKTVAPSTAKAGPVQGRRGGGDDDGDQDSTG